MVENGNNGSIAMEGMDDFEALLPETPPWKS